MNVFSTVALGLVKPLAKIFGKMTTDKDKVLESQASLRRMELENSPQSYLKLWMGFLGWILSLYLVFALIVHPLIAFYFPSVPLPDMPLDDVFALLMGMLGITL